VLSRDCSIRLIKMRRYCLVELARRILRSGFYHPLGFPKRPEPVTEARINNKPAYLAFAYLLRTC
jgi:hypothetical protein